MGLGLIGGSMAIDLKRYSDHTILGASRRVETCRQAVTRGIVDDASPDLQLMATADIVFLCTPLGAIETTVEQLIPQLQPATILTDVGSVKASVVKTIAPRWKNFVGGHPMAGTADSGLDAAQADLFVDRPYVLTPIDSTPPDALETVAQIARSLRSRIYQCRPEDHDRAVAWISHLPVMVSASLIAACLTEANPEVLTLAKHLASSGFQDTSRVGGGNPELGVMMAHYNQTALLHSLRGYRDRLDQIIEQIETGNWDSLEQQLKETQQARSAFL